jgi:hypothetical protein
MLNKNIRVVRNLIQCLPLAVLRDPIVVANLIRAFGIVQWGPPVFGDEEIYKNRQEDMAGIYQTPGQLAAALVYLSTFKIESYLEVGVFQGGCFLFVSEYLRRFNPEIRCQGIDPTGYLNPEIRDIIAVESWINFAPVTSDMLAGETWPPFDLVLIDGDHTTAWVERDWANVGRRAKICLIHDIQETSCPDIVAFWAGLEEKEHARTMEFLEHSSPVPLQGIGLIHNAPTEVRS